LNAVLHRLEATARRRAFVLCGVDLELPQLDWLRPRKRAHVSMALYDARAFS